MRIREIHAVGTVAGQHPDLGAPRLEPPDLRGIGLVRRQDQGIPVGMRQQPRIDRKAQPAVEHDRLRIVAGAAAHGEARIVGQHGVDAHQQRIVSRAQQVRHVEGFLRAEREGTRGTRGDAPVDALRIAEGDEGPAGRPPCPLCDEPLDPEGHICVRTNGYRRGALAGPDDDAEE